MHRSVARARRWRCTIGGILLVVGIWTYYIFRERRIEILEIEDKDIGFNYFGEDRMEGNNLYELANNKDANQTAKKTVPQKVVILITQFRSDSSFAEQVLSANKGTMYLSEPLLPFGIDCKAIQDQKLALLSRILSCNFNNLQREYDAGFKQSHFQNAGECASKGYCLPHASFGLLKGYTAVCNWIYYRRTTVTEFNPKSPSCGFPLKEYILNEQCLNSKLISTKVTRVCSIKELQTVYDFLTSAGREVYVIHFVRDPRSTIFSRINNWKEIPANITKEVCERLRMNLEILKNTESGTRDVTVSKLVTDGRYLRIRFEDISMDAILWAKRLFRFIGSDMPPEVERNIRTHLQQDTKKSTKLLGDEKQKTEAKRIFNWMSLPFTAIKDSKEVLRKWRKTITWKMVQDVQEECADVMEYLGYILFKDEQVFRNTSIPFFKPST